MLTVGDTSKLDRVQQAISRLASATVVGETVRVALPVSYPSGNCAAVEININGQDCFVTDCALGYAEAEFSAVQSYYDNSARIAAKHFGVGYDGTNVFATWVPLARLESAIVAVANASAQAVSAAVLRSATDRERRANTELFDKITAVFGRRRVAKTADLRGKEAEWEVHNVVSADGGIAVFEFVSAHPNSIANKFLMFSDLSKVDSPPSLNSVVRSFNEIGAKGIMLADVSNMFELSAANDDYRRYARLIA